MPGSTNTVKQVPATTGIEETNELKQKRTNEKETSLRKMANLKSDFYAIIVIVLSFYVQPVLGPLYGVYF